MAAWHQTNPSPSLSFEAAFHLSASVATPQAANNPRTTGSLESPTPNLTQDICAWIARTIWAPILWGKWLEAAWFSTSSSSRLQRGIWRSRHHCAGHQTHESDCASCRTARSRNTACQRMARPQHLHTLPAKAGGQPCWTSGWRLAHRAFWHTRFSLTFERRLQNEAPVISQTVAQLGFLLPMLVQAQEAIERANFGRRRGHACVPELAPLLNQGKRLQTHSLPRMPS